MSSLVPRQLSDEQMNIPEALFAQAGLGSWHWNIEADHVTWSKELYRIFGFDPALPPPNWEVHSKIYAPPSFALLAKAVDDCLKSGVPYLLELEGIHSSGQPVFVEAHGAASRDDNGRIASLFGIVLDRTSQRQVEEALRESEERFRLAFSNANAGMCIVDLQGVLLQVNAKMSAIFGYSKSELEGMTVNDLAHPEDIGLSPQYLQEAMESGQDSKVFEKRYRHKEGQIIYAVISSSLVRGSDGHPLYFISHVQDITGQKRTDDQLRASEARHRLLEENSRDVVWTMEIDGTISYISPSIEKVRGLTPAEAMAQTLEEIHPPESLAINLDYFSRMRAALEAGLPPENFRGELEYICKDGSTIWTEVLAYPVFNTDGSFAQLVGVTRDISERKQAAEDLKRSRQKAEELAERAEAAARAKSEFLAVMSHELRTPLNGVLGFAEFLRETPLNETQCDYVNTICDSGNHLLDVVNDILDFSSLEQSRTELQIAPTNLIRLATSACASVRIIAETKGLTFRCLTDENMPPVILCDERRVRQILLNLLGNAVKFTQAGSVTLSISVGYGKSETLTLKVTDTGPGIEPAILPSLFTPFTQADSTLRRGFEGTGLGLAVSQKLAALMGGQITAASRVGQGSEFRFDFPLRIASEGRVELVPKDAQEALIALGPGTHVLVAEDDQVSRKLLRMILRQLGGTARFVENGLEAFDAVRSGGVSVVLMDMQMPVMDGVEATLKIREFEASAGGHVPIIALTANVMSEDRQHCLAIGMDDFITKPIKIDKLARKLNAHLSRSAGGMPASS